MHCRNCFRNVRMELEQHVTEGCSTLHHGPSYSSPDIIMVIKSTSMRLAGNVACTYVSKQKCIHWILVGKI